jgi:ABC-type long-subunit fatty acid transport system fused permease/ATPase subunit
MDLITVVMTLIVVGVLLWAINKYIPMAASIKNILNIVVVIVVVLWLLQGFGVIDNIHNVKIK